MRAIDIKSNLTGREYEIMEFVSKGKYNKEIGDELHLDETTIKKHLQNIFHKFGVNNRTEATLKFLEQTGRIIFVTPYVKINHVRA